MSSFSLSLERRHLLVLWKRDPSGRLVLRRTAGNLAPDTVVGVNE
jgi:hypothetical protein